jgi:hypothetical protein
VAQAERNGRAADDQCVSHWIDADRISPADPGDEHRESSMTHNLGPIIEDGRTFDETTGLDLVPGTSRRFVILHFDSVNLTGAAKLTVNLGYGTDVFNASSGSSFWSRPVDTAIGTVAIRIVDGSGSARLRRFGSGEPTETADDPGTPTGSRSNPDVFLHTDPYQEPIYETRLKCSGAFDWRNAACPRPDDSRSGEGPGRGGYRHHRRGARRSRQQLFGDADRSRSFPHGAPLPGRSLARGHAERVRHLRLRHNLRRRQAGRAHDPLLQGH